MALSRTNPFPHLGDHPSRVLPPKARFAAAFLPAILLFLRHPERLLHAQFWAEDGPVFFRDSFTRGLLQPLSEPHAGYLHTLRASSPPSPSPSRSSSLRWSSISAPSS